ncbi:MAG TPA: pyruvate dehydrogenase (acetyl-transferring), homodimeric type [Bacteroidales bacterium]|nr:pyruvate dehydrogenase (acetyl-transferring), homodimeric type [Bacteroidales bacterium]
MSKEDKSKIYETENREWLDSLEYILQHESPDRVNELLTLLNHRASQEGIHFSCPGTTPYINTIPRKNEVPYPGSREIERRIKSIVRWNAMAMVVRANRESTGIGGHISTYASAATLFEIGFNHFFKGGDKDNADMVYFQGHASPGVYARSFLEGRLSEKDLKNFRQELREGGGLSSYPHPRLMPGYWQFPTVSMGLSPLMAIYQARFYHYLVDKGLKENTGQKVWALLGDGEMDEPESMGALTLASREKLDNLVFVVNCNLQRLDGPVRGNGKVVQELEAAFKGAGWNVIKVIWGSDWDQLLEKDHDGLLMKRMNEIVDGQSQKYSVADGAFIRKDFFGTDERLQKMVENYSDEQLQKMVRGGHDPKKVYNAFRKAMGHEGSPSVILAVTIKGYGLGEAGEGRNVTHQQKKLNEEELLQFRSRFNIPVSDKDVGEAPFYKPKEDSEEIKYLKKRREELGGYLPKRNEKNFEPINMPADKIFEEYYKDSGDREVATTMVIVQLMSGLLKDEKIGKLVVPIVPDESRTFGMDALFRQVGIYSHVGQLYEPVDRESLLYYKEATNGAILEEGITEAGGMSSFIAAGTAGVTHGINTIPFFIFYSMFGFQRVGDLIWAAGDMRAKGFLVGGTSGRTTLPGEGLQHADGNSHMLAFSVPNVRAWDPAFAYEVAVIVKSGLKRMYVDNEDVIFYITVMNEKYHMPEMPVGAEEGILKGMYRYKKTRKRKIEEKVHLLGSGAIFLEAMKAAEILENDFDIPADVWSVTSYKELYLNATDTERNNFIKGTTEKNTIEEAFNEEKADVVVAATDYLKAVPLSVSKYFPCDFYALGTDGFGRSDNRKALRDFFEVDARHIAITAIAGLYKQRKVSKETYQKAIDKLQINQQRINPVFA